MNKLLIIFTILFISSALPVFARPASESGLIRKTTVSVDRVSLKEKAVVEINRRIQSLTTAQNHISAIKKISQTDKASLVGQITAQIQTLEQLKAQIQAETDINQLRTLVKSITQTYRIYWLFLPKSQILAAADRILQVSTDLSAAAAKLSAPDSITAKITSAQQQAKTAIDLVTALQPDNGDTKVLQANTAALKSARSAIQSAHKSLVSAMQDLRRLSKPSPTP